jgi:hypothetical protein
VQIRFPISRDKTGTGPAPEPIFDRSFRNS